MEKLDEVLAAYEVADADKALLDRIVNAAEAQDAQSRRSAVWRQAAMFAALAVFGFWLGMAQPQAKQDVAATETPATQQENYLDKVILGPDGLSGVTL